MAGGNSTAISTSLVFTPANWDTDQTVTLVGVRDPDTQNNTAVVRCQVVGLDDWEYADVAVMQGP